MSSAESLVDWSDLDSHAVIRLVEELDMASEDDPATTQARDREAYLARREAINELAALNMKIDSLQYSILIADYDLRILAINERIERRPHR